MLSTGLDRQFGPVCRRGSAQHGISLRAQEVTEVRHSIDCWEGERNSPFRAVLTISLGHSGLLVVPGVEEETVLQGEFSAGRNGVVAPVRFVFEALEDVLTEWVGG
jgi:hypothetical protein